MSKKEEKLTKEAEEEVTNLEENELQQADEETNSQDFTDNPAEESSTSEIEKIREELAEEKDKFVRLLAEFDNFRKRTAKEKEILREVANEGLMAALLPVLDNFARTIDTIEKTDNLTSIKEGISLVAKNANHILEKNGLEGIVSIGQEFDSTIHEAITSIPVEEAEKKGVVLDEVEKGYKLNGKVIRYAKVVVGE